MDEYPNPKFKIGDEVFGIRSKANHRRIYYITILNAQLMYIQSSREHAYTYKGFTKCRDLDTGRTEYKFSEDDLYPTIKEALNALEGCLGVLKYDMENENETKI